MSDALFELETAVGDLVAVAKYLHQPLDTSQVEAAMAKLTNGQSPKIRTEK